jgi:hypothetical protein
MQNLHGSDIRISTYHANILFCAFSNRWLILPFWTFLVHGILVSSSLSRTPRIGLLIQNSDLSRLCLLRSESCHQTGFPPLLVNVAQGPFFFFPFFLFVYEICIHGVLKTLLNNYNLSYKIISKKILLFWEILL